MRRRALAAWTLVLVTAGCTSTRSGIGSSAAPSANSGSSSTAASSSGRSTPSSPPSTRPPARSRAEQLLAHMTLAEKVGQLLMVDCPSTTVGAATVTAITTYHVGSVILDGTSYNGVAATAAVTAQLENDNPSPAKLFIATDQEGGLVQRLRGPGFDRVPSGVVQGGIAPAALQADAQQWGAQLRAAGVTVALSPVLDTVPADSPGNPPIGDLDRQFGSDPATVASHGVAVVRGYAASGVDATAKHFPGLGRVTGNTDLTTGVTDTVTTRNDPYLAPFRAAIAAGVPFVMMSTAVYARIDPNHPAAFSPTIVTGMLRHDLGFRGVVISDDVGVAKQVSGYPVGQRAVAFVAAGGDMVLTVDATQAAAMTSALVAQARSNPAFAAQVDAAALRVLTAKQARGLLD